MIFNTVGSIQFSVCPFCGIRLMLGTVSCPEADTVALPAVEIGDRSRPDLELEITEFVTGNTVVRSVKVDPVAKHARFSVRDIFPKRKDWHNLSSWVSYFNTSDSIISSYAHYIK